MFTLTWVVVVLAIVIYFYYRHKAPFVPFRIQILPNWYPLLKEHNLVDEKMWKKLEEKTYNDKETGYDLLRYGISFTVLKSDENSDLVYNNNRHSFHSRVDFRETIDDIKVQNKRVDMPYSPELWVKWGLEGYDIGITTPESFSKVVMVGDDNDLIKLTTVPYSLFRIPKQKRVEKQLKKYDLSRDDSLEKYKKEVLFPVVDELHHKYFTIYYNYV